MKELRVTWANYSTALDELFVLGKNKNESCNKMIKITEVRLRAMVLSEAGGI